MKNALVSVVIPVFNGAGHIKGAVENVREQTYRNIEIIVVDDGSTDDTHKMIEPFIGNSAIRYVHQPNKGLAAARNTGIMNARGEYIKFLDCDDLLYTQQIERQVEHLEGRADKAVSITDYQLEFESRNRKTVHVSMGNKSPLARFIESNLGPVHAYLLHRKLAQEVQGFDESLTSCEDTDFWLRALLHGCTLERLEYTGCCYRIIGDSMSSDAQKHFLQRCKVFEKLNQALLPDIKELPNDVRAELLKTNIKFVHICFARNIMPETCLPYILKTSGIIYGMKAGAGQKLLLKMTGFKNIALKKYKDELSKNKDYKAGLLNTSAWRDERNYP